jgi:hypothetical protein
VVSLTESSAEQSGTIARGIMRFPANSRHYQSCREASREDSTLTHTVHLCQITNRTPTQAAKYGIGDLIPTIRT